MKKNCFGFFLQTSALLFFLGTACLVRGQGTAFTYQGRLDDQTSPAVGTYDLRFALYDAAANGALVAGPVTNSAARVSNGLFAVTLDFGPGVFGGAPRWLEIAVRTNGAGAFSSLTPRQALTPSPYAIYSSSAQSAAQANAVAPGAVTGSGIAAGTITASNLAPGQVVKSLNGLTDVVTLVGGANTALAQQGNSLVLSSYGLWSLTGNTGADPANGSFLGTLDDHALELKVAGTRALRLEPNTNGAPNLIGGSPINYVDPGIVGATIGGGGTIATNFFLGGGSNHVGAIFGTIAGGRMNTIWADHAFIGGGITNTVLPFAYDVVIGGGVGNTAWTNAFRAVIGGGSFNQNAGSYSTVAGGDNNNIHTGADHSTIGGGGYNSITGSDALSVFSIIAGGYFNTTQTNVVYAAIGGGSFNSIVNNAQYATIPGGYNNSAGGNYSFAAGRQAQAPHSGAFVWSDGSGTSFSSTATNQFAVRATGGVRLVTGGAGLTVDGATVPVPLATPNDASHSNIVNVVEGAPVNSVSPGIYGATIGGGGAANYYGATYPNTVSADFGTVAGGAGNSIQLSASLSSIGGGRNNTVRSGAYTGVISGGENNTITSAAGSDSTIGGGGFNNVSSPFATIGGGAFNSIGTNSNSGTISGGFGHTISDFSYDGAIGGGSYATIGTNSYYVTIAGGRYNTVGNNSSASTIAGGFQSTIQPGATNAAIGGGYLNTVANNYGTVPGGAQNLAGGNYSFAAGNRAKALHDGTFVWSDSQSADFVSTGTNQFLVRAGGGVAINTNDSGGAALSVAGTVKATSFQGDGSGLLNVNAGAMGNYVFAYTGSHAVAVPNTYQDLPFSDAQLSGWSHAPGAAEYTNNQTGIYLVQYSAQATMTASSGTNISVQVALNSAAIPGSRDSVVLSPSSIQLFSLSRSIITPVNAADVLTIQYTGSSTASRVPSASLTVTRIQ